MTLQEEIQEEARAYLERARGAASAEDLARVVWEASGLLRVGRGRVYVPARFLKGPLAERSVRVSRVSQVLIYLEEMA